MYSHEVDGAFFGSRAALRGFSPGTPVFPTLQKPHLLNTLVQKF